MKHVTFIMLVLSLFNHLELFSQPCLPDGITFNSQVQIDSFQINYPNCDEIEGDVIILGDDITNLNGLIVLTSIGGDLLINSNDNLTSLTGLEGLNFIEGDLSIGYISIFGGNWALTTLSGLENLDSIGGNFLIYNNPIINLVGLDNLLSIGGDLTIHSNFSLTNLTGLDNLASIGGSLSINFNYSLTSIAGLENIDAATLEDLTINVNTSLSTCEVESICSYLASPNGIIYIHNNASGCNNPDEVADACETVSVNEVHILDKLSIYPNPCDNNTSIEFSLSNSGIVNLSVFDISGKCHDRIILEKLNIGKHKIIWNSAHLKNGVYFIRLETENEFSVQKVFKL